MHAHELLCSRTHVQLLRSAGYRVPYPFAVVITTFQIAQMAMGLTVSWLVYHWMQEGDCNSYLNNIVWSSLMYLSYLVLFSFYQTYLKGKGGNTGKSSKTD